MGKSEDLDNPTKIPAYVVGAGMLALMVTLILSAFDQSDKIAIGGHHSTETLVNGQMSALSKSVIYNYVYAFEVVGILLLAELIGAVVMARKD
jgi:NADH:ubiquinone oxidoreductase subunit 6 (subunit J)